MDISPNHCRAGTGPVSGLKRLIKIVLAVLLALAAISAFIPRPAFAADFTVNTYVDSTDPGSLRWAIAQSNSNQGSHTITVPTGTYTLSPGLGSLEITSHVTITGANGNPDGDAAQTIIEASDNVDTANMRVFDINPLLDDNGYNVTLKALTIRHGNAGVLSSYGGAGIAADTGRSTVTIYNCIVENNKSSYQGAGLYISGLAGGTFHMENTIVRNNTADGAGGGIYIEGDLNAAISSSSIQNNISLYSQGGGMTIQPATAATGTITIGSSTITGNTAVGTGGEGGGIYLSSPATISDTMISGNVSDVDGGGLYYANYLGVGLLTLNNNTKIENNNTLQLGKTKDLYIHIGAYVAQDQAAPTGLAGVAPTSVANNDGKITGVTDRMEYRLQGATNYTPVTAAATEISGLAAGDYQVRYAAKAGFNAGTAADVVVAVYVAPNQDQAAPIGLAGVAPTSAANNDGKITGVTDSMEYRLQGATNYTPVTAAATEISGLAAGSYQVRYAAKAGFNAGTAADVVVTAYGVHYYSVSIGTLTGGSITASPTTATTGAAITLTVTPNVGKQLKTGTLKYNDGTAHDITGTSFTMPPANVTVTAEFEQIPSIPIAAPTIQSATTDNSGTKIILTFSKAMANPGSSAGAFNISVVRDSASITESVTNTRLGSNNTQLILSLARPLFADDTVSVSYTPGTLTSADGGTLGAINNKTVINEAPRPIVVNNQPITVSSDQQYLAITPDTITTAGNNPVFINVLSGTTNAALNLASILPAPSAGTVTSSALPAITISAAVNLNSGTPPVNVQVQIPQGTTVSAPAGWDGTLHLPTVAATNSVTVTPSSGNTATVNSVIEVGYGDVPLTFNHAVRLLIPGQAGKKAGYVRSGTFYSINTLLSADNQSTADSTLAAGQDGYLNVGSDLVIWTKHFTEFVTYTETPIYTGGRNTYIPAPTPDPTPTVSSVQRLFGQNQVDTALAIAKASYPSKVANVILATAENYPDALTGSVLAYKLNAPILLVGSTVADQEKILAYLKTSLDVTGTVYILGGTAVVSADMEAKVTASGFNHITRLGGIDRYETAAKITDQLGVKTGTPIVLVYGENYADALAISSIAAGMQSPILLVQKDGISDIVKQKIAEIKPTKVYIIGGEGVIGATVESQVAQITSLDKANIVRIAGVDRYETSLAVAQYFNLSGQSVCIATGNNFPDALAGSVYAANHNAPIILADGSLSDQVMNYLQARKLTGATLFGGEAVVSKDIEQQLGQLIGK